MYGRHPNSTWSASFPGEKLKALSVHPLLVFPTHYTGEQGYFSDTEDASVISDGVAAGTESGEEARKELDGDVRRENRRKEGLASATCEGLTDCRDEL